jgi:hypothetical protein
MHSKQPQPLESQHTMWLCVTYRWIWKIPRDSKRLFHQSFGTHNKICTHGIPSRWTHPQICKDTHVHMHRSQSEFPQHQHNVLIAPRGRRCMQYCGSCITARISSIPAVPPSDSSTAIKYKLATCKHTHVHNRKYMYNR